MEWCSWLCCSSEQQKQKKEVVPQVDESEKRNKKKSKGSSRLKQEKMSKSGLEETLIQEKHQMEDKIHQLNQTCQQQCQKNKHKQKKLDELSNQLEKYKEQINKVSLEVGQLNIQLNSETQKNKEMQEQLNIEKKLRKRTQQEFDQYKKDQKAIIFQLSDQKMQQNHRFQELTIKCRGQQSTIESLSQRLQTSKTQAVHSNQQISLLKRQLEQKQEQMRQMNEAQNILRRQKEEETRKLQRHSLLDGEILQSQPTEKDYLLDTLEGHTGMHIARSTCLYTYDPLNKVNFHKYFDFHPHLLIVIKLATGVIVAAYSEGPFQPKITSNQDGLLMTATYQDCFQLRTTNKRAITYDDYYMIFGNSEVRIKAGEAKLFSNFGIANSFYDHRGVRVNGFIGQGEEREVALASYEIYQLEWEDTA